MDLGGIFELSKDAGYKVRILEWFGIELGLAFGVQDMVLRSKCHTSEDVLEGELLHKRYPE